MDAERVSDKALELQGHSILGEPGDTNDWRGTPRYALNEKLQGTNTIIIQIFKLFQKKFYIKTSSNN